MSLNFMYIFSWTYWVILSYSWISITSPSAILPCGSFLFFKTMMNFRRKHYFSSASLPEYITVLNTKRFCLQAKNLRFTFHQLLINHNISYRGQKFLLYRLTTASQGSTSCTFSHWLTYLWPLKETQGNPVLLEQENNRGHRERLSPKWRRQWHMESLVFFVFFWNRIEKWDYTFWIIMEVWILDSHLWLKD